MIQPYYNAPIKEILTDTYANEVNLENTVIIKTIEGMYKLSSSDGLTQNINENLALEMKGQGFELIEED